MQARDILRLGLQNVSYSRQVVALTDGKSIADISWVKVSGGWVKGDINFVKVIDSGSVADID